MGKQRLVWVLVVGLGACGLSVCGSSPSNQATTSTTAIAPAAAVATGTYSPSGSSGEPHYVVTVSSAENTDFDGSVKFIYQDGKTTSVFDFNAHVTGQSAEATPSDVATTGSGTKTVSSVPSTLRIQVGADKLTLVGCQAYMPETQTSDACTFVRST